MRFAQAGTWILVGAALVAGGCAKTGPGFKRLGTTTATTPIAGGDLYPLLDGQWCYLVTVGATDIESFTRTRLKTDRFEATWADHDGERRIEYWRVNQDGNLVMPAVIDLERGALTFFDPPLIITYTEIEPARSYVQQVELRVMDARTPRRQRDAGTGTCTIRYVDDQLLQTPMGRFQTHHLEVHFKAKLKLATVETISNLYIAPGIGPIVIERQETIRFLFLPIAASDQTLVLTASPVSITAGATPQKQ